MANHPPAIICIGRNYAEHASELGHEILEHPIVFFKNPASICGATDTIHIPTLCKHEGPQVDYEGELAVFIGRDCCCATLDNAMSFVSGYAVANDVSARWWQTKGSGGQYCRGKSFNTFCPLSDPVDAATVNDPQALAIRTTLNGEVVQESTTSSMIHPVAKLISELSTDMTLLAGTVLLTGTPAGVGAGRTPPLYLKDGDIIEVAIEGVGALRNQVVEN